MAKMQKAAVPDNISEEYYQISEEILSSFSKYRPPVDLYQFREDIAQLYPLYRKGQRLSNEQVDEVQALCRDGSLFVARSDHAIYVEHIAKQADLVLVDVNLKEGEVADILLRALEMRLTDFMEQPVTACFEPLYKDLMVLTEYLTQDRFRARLFMRRLPVEDKGVVVHSISVMTIGLWLHLENLQQGEFKRRFLDRLALGLLLHDVGLTKVPAYIREKTTPLKADEWEKIYAHSLAGIKMMQKLNLSFDELNGVILHHHERLDGSGYPQKLKGDAISAVGRIAGVADSFAAMITKRSYAPAKNAVDAAKELVADKARYDARYTVPLQTAYLTGLFGSPGQGTPAREAGAAAKTEGSGA